MSSQHAAFEKFYDARIQAHRQTFGQDQFWDRYTQPSVLIPALIVLLTIIFQRYATPLEPAHLATSAADGLWDALVYLTPRALLETLDRRANPSLAANIMPTTQLDTHAAKSEAMRRVLGLDRSGGMMATVIQARNRAFSVTAGARGSKFKSDRPPGLGNRDNSCYQNSILQSLASLDPLPDYLTTCLSLVGSENGDKEIAQTLRTLVSDLNDTSNNGRTLWTPSLLKSMSTWTQQDAQEYFSKMLDDIDKGLAKSLKAKRSQAGLEGESSTDSSVASQHSDDSGYQSQSSGAKPADIKSLRNPLEGLLAQRVACVRCGYSEGLSMTPFNCLTLSLDLDRNSYDLRDRLNAYSKLEMIEGVECPRCTLLKTQRLMTRLIETMRQNKQPEASVAEIARRIEAVELALEEDDFSDETMRDKCKVTAQTKVSSTKTKQIVIARPPQSLVIHMNRSVFDPNTFNMMKNSAPVSFPLTLDLGPWCLGSAIRKPGEGLGDESEQEKWQLGPTASMIAGDGSTSRLTGPIYQLKAAVTHAGRHENGHYICYRRYPRHESPSLPQEPEETQEDVDGDADAAAKESGDAGQETESQSSKEGSPAEPVPMDWWRLSDENVSRVDESTVLSLSPGVFMLFYDCIDPSMVLQSNDDHGESTPEASPESEHASPDEAAAPESESASVYTTDDVLTETDATSVTTPSNAGLLEPSESEAGVEDAAKTAPPPSIDQDKNNDPTDKKTTRPGVVAVP